MSEIDAVVAGHLCLDLYPDLSEFEPGKFLDFMLPGKLLNIGRASFGTGGVVANTGQALHKLGLNCRLIGKVGKDVFGQAIRNILGASDPALVLSCGEFLRKPTVISK